jgi:hypothetical protein
MGGLMMKNYKWISLFAFTLFVAISLACNSISVPRLFATTTPVPTDTATPLPTSTPMPTPQPTATPQPTGVECNEQADGSTLCVDYDNQYQFILPADWTVLPVAAMDFSSLADQLIEKNPDFKNILGTFKNMDPNVIRAIALNVHKQYIESGYGANISVMALDDAVTVALPMELLMGSMENGMPAGAILVSSETKTNANGVEIGIMELQLTVPTITSQNVDILSRLVLFKANNKLIMVDMSALKKFGETLLPGLDVTVDSVELLNP